MADYPTEQPAVAEAETLTKDTVRQRIFIVVLVATMGALAFGYDTGIISGSLPFMSAAPSQGGLGLNSFTEGLVADFRRSDRLLSERVFLRPLRPSHDAA